MPFNLRVTSEAFSVKARKSYTMNDLGKQVLTKKRVVVNITPRFSFFGLEMLWND